MSEHKHVDDMTVEERYEFRSRQVADLVVLAQREGLDPVADRVSQGCDVSTRELLLVAVAHLADFIPNLGGES